MRSGGEEGVRLRVDGGVVEERVVEADPSSAAAGESLSVD